MGSHRTQQSMASLILKGLVPSNLVLHSRPTQLEYRAPCVQSLCCTNATSLSHGLTEKPQPAVSISRNVSRQQNQCLVLKDTSTVGGEASRSSWAPQSPGPSPRLHALLYDARVRPCVFCPRFSALQNPGPVDQTAL